MSLSVIFSGIKGEKMGKLGYKIGATICWMLLFTIPIVCAITIVLPVDAIYNKQFASHVTMAYDQATFEGMQNQVLIVWREMNNTFGTTNLENIYSTPWFWQQTYDNSLAAERDYLANLNSYFTGLIKEKNEILAGNKTILIPYYQWYQAALESSRKEMQREGGLDWAIRPAWYLGLHPINYWLLWWLIPLEILIVCIAALLTINALGIE
jgi:hypothetical protein